MSKSKRKKNTLLIFSSIPTNLKSNLDAEVGVCMALIVYRTIYDVTFALYHCTSWTYFISLKCTYINWTVCYKLKKSTITDIYHYPRSVRSAQLFYFFFITIQYKSNSKTSLLLCLKSINNKSMYRESQSQKHIILMDFKINLLIF